MVLYNNMEIELSIFSLLNCSLGKLFSFAVNNNYHYNVGDIIENNNQSLIVRNHTRINYNNGKSSKGYDLECLKCGNTYTTSEANLERGDGCNFCSNHKIIVGKNDLWTTRPDIAKMLRYSSDGYSLMEYSNVKADFVCPICGEYIGKSYIHNVTRFGLSCPKCSSGNSYPNRLMNNLLSVLNEEYVAEHVFDWCRFKDYTDSSKVSYGRYDFVIENKKLIIEMDGGIGHGNNPFPGSRYSKEELIYRDNCKDELARNHGYMIIRIDCNYSSHDRFLYCSSNIINSQLSTIYDLNKVDWEYVNKISILA